MNKKIIFLHPNWQNGGVERTNMQWAEIFEKNSFKVNFYTTGNDVRINDNRFKYFSSIYFAAIAAIKKKDSIIIVCQSYIHVRLLPILIFTNKQRLYLTERNSFQQYSSNIFKFYFYRLLFRLSLRVFGRIIANSSEIFTEQPFRSLNVEKFVVHNPRFNEHDLARIKKIKHEKLVNKKIVMFCRWNVQKNLPFIHKSAEIFANHGYEFNVFCGEKEHSYQKPWVKDVLNEMIIQKPIIFFCSKFEGYPNVLLEARAVGLPIIYSECPTGVKEILKNYENKFRFEKNNLRSLSKQLAIVTDLLNDDKLHYKPDLKFAKFHHIDNSNLLDVI